MFYPRYSLKLRPPAFGWRTRRDTFWSWCSLKAALRCASHLDARQRGSAYVWNLRKASGSQGFSLVEILCAILVLAVALTAMVQAITTALGSTKESELQTVAALFASGQVETLRAEGDLRDGTKEGDCGEGLSLYQWQQTIAPGGIDGLHDVTVVVQNAKSGKSIYELKTLLFELPDGSGTNSPSARRDSTSQRRRNSSR